MKAAVMFDVLKVALIATTMAMAYCLPMIMATSRRHPRRKVTALLNAFLGWTFLGWVVALLWAKKRPTYPRAGISRRGGCSWRSATAISTPTASFLRLSRPTAPSRSGRASSSSCAISTPPPRPACRWRRSPAFVWLLRYTCVGLHLNWEIPPAGGEILIPTW